MTDDETPKVGWEEDIPAEPPLEDRGAEPEIHDQPMGVPNDADERDGEPLPGLPETEPPSGG